jgi:hypothetical protein
MNTLAVSFPSSVSPYVPGPIAFFFFFYIKGLWFGKQTKRTYSAVYMRTQVTKRLTFESHSYACVIACVFTPYKFKYRWIYAKFKYV